MFDRNLIYNFQILSVSEFVAGDLFKNYVEN